jgi:hypothetical protein
MAQENRTFNQSNSDRPVTSFEEAVLWRAFYASLPVYRVCDLPKLAPKLTGVSDST